MQLPGRLRATTLGDLLGTVHRARATGTLELVEFHGRAHRIHVKQGLVAAVEMDGAAASLAEVLRRDRSVDDETLRRSLLRAMASRRLHGEVLVRDFRLPASVVQAALRQQLLTRLSVLDQLADAQVFFRVTLRAPRGALSDEPLSPPEFLSGRPRARDRRGSPRSTPRERHDHEGSREEAPAARPLDAKALAALRVLGVPPGADAIAIKRAFRVLARAYHPDTHPGASDEERRELSQRFVAVTSAYQVLSN